MATRTLVHEQYSRLRINQIGLWLFIASEFMVFVALLVARFSLQGTFRPDELNQQIGLVITSLLLLSSLTAYRAEARIASGDDKSFLRYTLATIVLGLIFLVGVAFEWSQALIHFPPTTGFGTIFFTMTGMHAFHVITGMIALLLLLILIPRIADTTAKPWILSALAAFAMLGVVWLFGQIAFTGYQVPSQGCTACHQPGILGGAPTALSEFEIRDPDWLVFHLREPEESILSPAPPAETLP